MASRQSYWLLKRVVRANVTAKLKLQCFHVPSGVAPTAGVSVSKSSDTLHRRHLWVRIEKDQEVLTPRTLDFGYILWP